MLVFYSSTKRSAWRSYLMKKWKWCVYIIECLDNTYYTGFTWKPEVRYEQHLSKFGSKYTVKHGVRELVYLEEFEDFEVAKNREQQIKNWSQKKKKKLISGEWKK